MGLTLNTIITLENSEKYIVLDEILHNGSKYFMVIGVNNNKEVIPDKVNILKEYVKGLDTYISIVKDQELILELTKLFKENN